MEIEKKNCNGEAKIKKWSKEWVSAISVLFNMSIEKVTTILREGIEINGFHCICYADVIALNRKLRLK